MKEEVDWRQKFLEMRRNCRAANKGARTNKLVIDNLTARYRAEFNEKIKIKSELEDIRSENKALNTMLYNCFKKIEMLERQADKLEIRRRK